MKTSDSNNNNPPPRRRGQLRPRRRDEEITQEELEQVKKERQEDIQKRGLNKKIKVFPGVQKGLSDASRLMEGVGGSVQSLVETGKAVVASLVQANRDARQRRSDFKNDIEKAYNSAFTADFIYGIGAFGRRALTNLFKKKNIKISPSYLDVSDYPGNKTYQELADAVNKAKKEGKISFQDVIDTFADLPRNVTNAVISTTKGARLFYDFIIKNGNLKPYLRDLAGQGKWGSTPELINLDFSKAKIKGTPANRWYEGLKAEFGDQEAERILEHVLTPEFQKYYVGSHPEDFVKAGEEADRFTRLRLVLRQFQDTSRATKIHSELGGSSAINREGTINRNGTGASAHDLDFNVNIDRTTPHFKLTDKYRGHYVNLVKDTQRILNSPFLQELSRRFGGRPIIPLPTWEGVPWSLRRKLLKWQLPTSKANGIYITPGINGRAPGSPTVSRLVQSDFYGMPTDMFMTDAKIGHLPYASAESVLDWKRMWSGSKETARPKDIVDLLTYKPYGRDNEVIPFTLDSFGSLDSLWAPSRFDSISLLNAHGYPVVRPVETYPGSGIFVPSALSPVNGRFRQLGYRWSENPFITHMQRAMLNGGNPKSVNALPLTNGDSVDRVVNTLTKDLVSQGADPTTAKLEALKQVGTVVTDPTNAWAWKSDSGNKYVVWNRNGYLHYRVPGTKDVGNIGEQLSVAHEYEHAMHFPKYPVPAGIYDPTKARNGINEYFFDANNTELGARFGQLLDYRGVDRKVPVNGEWLKFTLDDYLHDPRVFDNNMSDMRNVITDWDGFAAWGNNPKNVFRHGK